MALFVVLAIVLSFFASNHDSKVRDRNQANQLVMGCGRNSEKSVLDAAYKQATSDTRRAAGTPKDILAANRYQMFALGALDLIPLPHTTTSLLPPGVSASEALRYVVTTVPSRFGQPAFRVRPKVLAILKKGCVEAYT